MVLESEHNRLLKQARIQALQDALDAQPTFTLTKDEAIRRLLDDETSLATLEETDTTTTFHINIPEFQIRNLSVLAYANGFTLWHYKGMTAILDDMRQSRFFADASDMLVQGDMIMCSAKDGCRMLYVRSIDINMVHVAQS